MQIIFCSGTKSLKRAQYLKKFWSNTKFGLSQTILGPVEGQGMSQACFDKKSKKIKLLKKTVYKFVNRFFVKPCMW